MDEDSSDSRVSVSVPRYDASSGVSVDELEGGTLTVELAGDGVVVSGDAAGLRNLARWCLALSDAQSGSHVHLDPGQWLLDDSEALVVVRADALASETP
jgi:hypothetical protein